MRELKLKVDRVEEGIAVCYAPDGGMIDVPLPEGLTVCDGNVIAVMYDGDFVVSVSVVETVDPKSEERRARLNRLFDRK